MSREPLIFDSHAHYDMPEFDQDRDELLRALPEAGVCGVVNCGSSLAGSRASVALAARYDYVYAAVGFHPEELPAAPDAGPDALFPLLREKKVVAVGEIGLDYHKDSPRDRQLRWFEAQLTVAKEANLPVIIHDREAHADTLRLLQKYRPAGVVHYFSGSVEMAEEVLRQGMYIGLGGAVTFKNVRHALEVADAVPLDRLLLETDAPYMAPVPFRGQRCDSSMIWHTAERIAELRHMSIPDLLQATKENAETLFHITRTAADEP